MNNYKKLDVWKESIELVSDVYLLLRKFPKYEMFDLSSQVRRSSISIPSNIAEGAGRNGDNEFINFLGISSGSYCELDTQLIIAERLGYITSEDTTNIMTRLMYIQKMNYKLVERLRSKK